MLVSLDFPSELNTIQVVQALTTPVLQGAAALLAVGFDVAQFLVSSG